MNSTDKKDLQIENLTREVERIEMWLGQHLENNLNKNGGTIAVVEIPVVEILDIYRLISDTLEKIYETDETED